MAGITILQNLLLNKIWYILLVVLPLIIGIYIYIVYRNDIFLYVRVFEFLDMKEFLDKIKETKMMNINKICIYSLPDGLYLFSVTSYFLLKMKYSIGIKIAGTFYIALIVSEIMQYCFDNKALWIGTFDKNDILCYTIGFFLSIFLVKKIKQYF